MTRTAAGVCLDELRVDVTAESQRIEKWIQEMVAKLHRRGAVLGLSGGVDSSVVASLCTRALGADRVLGVFMPELDSSDDSLKLGELVANSLGISTVLEDISAILHACGCYRRRDDAIRTLVPEYGSEWKSKLVLADLKSGSRYAVSSLVVRSPEGTERKVRLTARTYSEIVAASNFKQRTRKMLEYFHADRLQYAVVGTPNRLEYDQGFFVKNGDGAADLKPIAHLYKTQVYQLAEYLEIPIEIRQRPSTTDTFSLPQSQEEFYFSIPLECMDLCLFGKNHGISVSAIAQAADISPEQADLVYSSIEAKRKATAYLHLGPQLLEEIPLAGES